ncbi:flagellar brake protein [Pelosinus sp. sgz500959]|uniref:flagellar brake protein n=1 Tax=Pelosinus sp. sgz500959 TaxID=3242472 RepID=UPI00366BE3CF
MENFFRVNQRLEIRLSKNIKDQQYTSRIEEIIHNHMIIAMPMKKGYPVFHERGSIFYGKVFDGRGAYSFKSNFVDRKMTPLPIWIVTMPFDIVKTQQRSFVRFNVPLPVEIEYPADNEQNEVISIKAVTKDLSAGGLCVICDQTIKVGKQVNLLLDFPDLGIFQVDGEVVRMNQPQEDRKLYWISIKFVGVHEAIRDKISKFIFKKQLEQRQKGL